MNNMFDLSGKIAVVTGGNGGLGEGFAITLAKAHAKVAIIGRNVEKLSTVKKEIESFGSECFAVKCDVTLPNEVKAAIQTINGHFGKIDILVNNAGTSIMVPAEQMTENDFASIVNINLNSCYYVSREVGRIMINQRYGKIINIASINSNVTYINNNTSAYDASKGGVLMLTKSLASEWGKYGITVNAIGPGVFPSKLNNQFFENNELKTKTENNIPVKRLGRNGDLDGALLYFASDASSYTTGQILYVDGGISIV